MHARVGVLLADDRAASRKTLAYLLAADGRAEVVGQTSLSGAAASAGAARPDVVLAGVGRCSVGRAAEAVARLLALPWRPEVVVLGADDDPRLIGGVLDAGAGAYVSRGAPLGELLEAVWAVAGDPSRRAHGGALGAGGGRAPGTLFGVGLPPKPSRLS